MKKKKTIPVILGIISLIILVVLNAIAYYNYHLSINITDGGDFAGFGEAITAYFLPIISLIIVAIIWIIYGIVKLIKYIIQRIKNKTMTTVVYFYIFIVLLFLSVGIFFIIKCFSY